MKFFRLSLLLASLLAFSNHAPAGLVTPVDLSGTTPPTPAPPPPEKSSAPSPAPPQARVADQPVNPTTPEKKTAPDPQPAPPAAAVNKERAPSAPAIALAASKDPAPAAAATPAAKAKASVFANYLSDLTDDVKLSADEKKDIQTYYLADGPALKDILNNDALSPPEQARQVADLRDKRNDKIDALLGDLGRQREFNEVEARYRVALTAFAADGGLSPAQPLPAVPEPTSTTPAQATGPTGSK